MPSDTLGKEGEPPHMPIWRRVVSADIPQETRDTLERYGEDAVAIILAQAAWPDGLDIRHAIPRAVLAGGDSDAQRRKLERARDWLNERHQVHENRERRLEILEWAIVVLIVVEIVLSSIGLAQGCNQPKPTHHTGTNTSLTIPNTRSN